MLKFSNAIGAPFRNFVSQQLKTRAQQMSKDTRNIQDVLYIANKDAWARLQSSVDVSAEYAALLTDYYNDREAAQPVKTEPGLNLAQNWVLQAGTSRIDNGQVTLRSGLGIEGAYGLGGITDQGYRPMPGLDSVTVETAGRLGSLRYATINFKVWNMNQLDAIDALYFRLGFTMLLEWGHVQYYDNVPTYQKDITGVDFFEKNITKEKIQKAINDKVETSCGNYDGMLGTVTNFNYSFNQEGGWDCSIKLVGLGNLLETQKINSSYTMPIGLAMQFKALQVDVTNEIRQGIDKTNAENREKADQGEKDRVNTQYDTETETFNRNHPVNNLQTFYSNVYKNTPPYDLGNASVDSKLGASMIVTPNNSQVLFDIDRNIFTKDVVVETDASVDDFKSDVGYLYNSAYLPAWVTADSKYGGNQSGFLFPLAVNNRYTLKRGFFDKVLKAAYDMNIGDYAEYAIPSVRSPLVKLIGGGFDYSSYTAFAYSVTNKPPDTGYYQTVAVDFFKGSSGRASHTITLDKHKWIVKPSIAAIGGNDYTTAKQAGFVFLLNNEDSELYKFLELLENAYTTAPNIDDDWVVTNIELKSINGSLTLDGADIAGGNTLTITIQKDLIIPGVPLYNTKGQPYSLPVDITATLQLVTNIPTILDKLTYVATNDAVPTKEVAGAGKYTKIAYPPTSDTDQGFSSLSSALEAMLTFVQYDAVVKDPIKPNPNVAVRSIEKVTAEILRTIKPSPLSNLFTATGFDKNYPKPEDPSKPEYYTDPYYLGLKGYNTSLMSGQTNNGGASNTIDAYKVTPDVIFEDLLYSYKLPKKYEDTNASGGYGTKLQPVYIKLGYLLFFINNLCLLFDSTKPGGPQTAQTARPYFYIDFNPETNFCLTTPYQLSVNPEVCIIPWNGAQADYEHLFELNGIMANQVYAKPNQKKNTTTKSVFNFDKNKKISEKLSEHGKFQADKYRGKTMNILVNTQHLLDILHDSINRDGHSDVYFKPFMDRLLEDINKAMGDLNTFRLGYIDSSNTAAILDDQFVPVKEDDASSEGLKSAMKLISPSGNFIVPIFGKTSIARSLDFQTNISTKMSSLIAIGARSTNGSNGSTQSTDGSSFHWLSAGLKDRIISEAEDASRVGVTGPPAQNTKNITNNQTLAQRFDGFIASIYSNDNTKSIDKAGITPSTNYYIQATTKRKATDPTTTGAPVIPLNLSFSTDGISGINMGNVFMIPEDKLPISLRAFTDGMPRFGYMVMGLNHQIQNNQWITDIKGQIIRLRTDESRSTGAAPAGTATSTTSQPTTQPATQPATQPTTLTATDPIVIRNTTTASLNDIDTAHNFSDMAVAINQAQEALYSRGINPKITSFTVSITNTGREYEQTYDVTVGKSPDGKAWMGFDTRGSGGSTYDSRADDQYNGTGGPGQAKFKKDGVTPNPCYKKSLKKCMQDYANAIDVELITTYVNTRDKFKQYFVQFTKSTKPPK